MTWRTTQHSVLREARQAANLTLPQAADKARKTAEAYGFPLTGLTFGSFSAYERGKTIPTADVIRVLARVYGVKVADLIPDLPRRRPSTPAA